MKYSDGKEVMLGDKIKLWINCNGIVVALIDAGKFSQDYPRDHWAYLRTGFLVATEKGGLIHYLKMDDDMILLERGDT